MIKTVRERSGFLGVRGRNTDAWWLRGGTAAVTGARRRFSSLLLPPPSSFTRRAFIHGFAVARFALFQQPIHYYYDGSFMFSFLYRKLSFSSTGALLIGGHCSVSMILNLNFTFAIESTHFRFNIEPPHPPSLFNKEFIKAV